MRCVAKAVTRAAGMPARALVVLSLLLWCVPTLLVADDWPVAPTTSQHNITGTTGEARFTAGVPRYHRGTDITGGSNVYAINAGTIDQVVVAGFYGSFVRIGGTYYYHINASLPTGTAVAIGDQIGTMRTDGPIHVHLQRAGTNFLAAVLDPFVDNTDATIFAHTFRRNPHSFTTTGTQLVQDDLNGKIDVVLNAQDTRLNSTGGNDGGATAPYQVRYDLEDAAGATVEMIDYITFTQYPADNTSASHVFGINSTTSNFNWIVTGHPFTMPYDRYWNTKGRDGVTEDWTGNVNLDARVNDEARYEDGRYDVVFAVRDIDNDATFNEVTQTENVIVDNWKPYVKRVEVGSTPQYLADWRWIATTAQLVFVRTTDDYLGPGTHTITIEFSEPVISPTLSIDTFTGGIPLTSAQPVNQQTIWTGSVTVTAGDPSHDGQQTMTIVATDLSANQLDGQPGSIATRDNAGAWTDTNDGGMQDQNHLIRIDATPPTTTISVTP